MPRPQIPTRSIPTIQTPIPDFPKPYACGNTADVDLIVRMPYKGVSQYEAQLSQLAQLPDPQSPYPPSTFDSVDGAIRDVRDTLAGKNPEIPLAIIPGPSGEFAGGEKVVPQIQDKDNWEAINNLLAYAEGYLKVARDLWTYWASEYKPQASPANARPKLSSWSLAQGPFDVYPFCEGQPPGGKIKQTIDGQEVEITCPTAAELQLHEGDVTNYVELMWSAIRYARCAQEAAYVLGLYYLNKRAYDQSVKPGEIAAPQPKPDIGDPGGLPPDFPPPPPPPNGGVQPAPPEAAKKGLSTVAKVGIAVVGGWAIWKFVLKK